MADALDEAAEARRQARRACEVRIFRPGSAAAEAAASALDWARIPLDERAEFVWQLSVDLCQTAGLDSAPGAAVGLHGGRQAWARRDHEPAGGAPNRAR